MKVANHDTDERILIIAEVGNNHEGNADVAAQMVRAAKESGADAVKFQTFKTELFTSAGDPARLKRLKGFELTQDEFKSLHDLARSLDLMFISTPLDLESAEFLEPLVDAFKVASGDNDFYPLLKRVAESDKPVIVSTGLADQAQVLKTKAYVEEHQKTPNLAILHCVSSYPTPPDQANLGAIRTLASVLSCDVGYSDHTNGHDACVAAAAMGARILEKHFTLDKHYSDFRDHQLSADPAELRLLVDGVRQVETLLGTGEKVVQDAEAPIREVARRSIYYKRDLPKGHVVAWDDLLWLRPAKGLPPGEESQVVGKTLGQDVSGSTLIELGHLS